MTDEESEPAEDRWSDPTTDDEFGRDADAESPSDEPDARDPFADIDGPERDGDPFDDLAAEAPGATDEDRQRAAGAPEDFDAFGFANGEDTAGAPGGPDGQHAPGDADAFGADEEGNPFDRLGSDGRPGDPFEGLGERPPDATDDEQLWADLSTDASEPETEQRGERRFAEVSKHAYCERCEYFSTPPAVACSHEGTDIVEFIDSETVRVADCPIVAERERLADLESRD